jgi:hypothetical protein
MHAVDAAVDALSLCDDAPAELAAGAETDVAAAAAATLPQEPQEPHPRAVWYPETRALLSACYGQARFAAIDAVLRQPPCTTCVRVNTLRARPDEVHSALQLLVGPDAVVRTMQSTLPEALLVRGSGPHAVDVSLAGGRELAVSRRCAEAVLRGADVYVPGVLGCSAGVEEGTLVAVTGVVEALGATSAGMTRGCVLPSLVGPPTRLLLGCGKRSGCQSHACCAVI